MTKQLVLFIFISILFADRVDVCIDPGHDGTDLGAVNYNYGVNILVLEGRCKTLCHKFTSCKS